MFDKVLPRLLNRLSFLNTFRCLRFDSKGYFFFFNTGYLMRDKHGQHFRFYPYAGSKVGRQFISTTVCTRGKQGTHTQRLGTMHQHNRKKGSNTAQYRNQLFTFYSFCFEYDSISQLFNEQMRLFASRQRSHIITVEAILPLSMGRGSNTHSRHCNSVTVSINCMSG